MNPEVGQRLGQVDHIAALAELQPGGNVGQPEDRHTVIAEEYAAAFSIENIGSPEHHGRELADDVPDIDDAILDQRCPGNRLHQLLGRDMPLSPGEIGRATSELQSLMRISYDVFCLKKKKKK